MQNTYDELINKYKELRNNSIYCICLKGNEQIKYAKQLNSINQHDRIKIVKLLKNAFFLLLSDVSRFGFIPTIYIRLNWKIFDIWWCWYTLFDCFMDNSNNIICTLNSVFILSAICFNRLLTRPNWLNVQSIQINTYCIVNLYLIWLLINYAHYQ